MHQVKKYYATKTIGNHIIFKKTDLLLAIGLEKDKYILTK